MRPDGVVLNPVFLSVSSQIQGVGDFFEEQVLVLERAEAALPGAILSWRPNSGTDMLEFRVRGDECFKPERAERSAVISDDRDQWRDFPRFGISGQFQ